MRKEDTGVWTVEFRPKEVRDLIDKIKQIDDKYEFLEKIQELEELLGLI